MRILSFDVGTKNLAWIDATITAETVEIHQWTVDSIFSSKEKVNVNKTAIDVLVPYFSRYCYEALATVWNHKYDAVFIESQPIGHGRSFGSPRNLKTKILSHILQHVLWSKTVPIHFISPMLKLKDCPVPFKERTYKDNKKYAVEKTLEIIGGTSEVPGNPLFVGRKQDDLADCFLQGLYATRAILSGAMKLDDWPGPEGEPETAGADDDSEVSKPKKRKSKDAEAPKAKKSKKSDKVSDIAAPGFPAASTETTDAAKTTEPVIPEVLTVAVDGSAVEASSPERPKKKSKSDTSPKKKTAA